MVFLSVFELMEREYGYKVMLIDARNVDGTSQSGMGRCVIR